MKKVIWLGLLMVLATVIYLDSDMFALTSGVCWIIGAVVLYKQIIRLACEMIKFVWIVMEKIWDYIMRL